MLKELKMLILISIKHFALRLILFYEEHVDIYHPLYIQDLKAEYLSTKKWVSNLESKLKEYGISEY